MEREAGDRSSAGDVGVVVHDDRAVSCEVNVQLDPVRAEFPGSHEGRDGVLPALLRRSPMGKNLGQIELRPCSRPLRGATDSKDSWPFASLLTVRDRDHMLA